MSRETSRLFAAVACIVAAGFISACGPSNTGQKNDAGQGECQVNSDCPGPNNNCDLLTHTCTNSQDDGDTGTNGCTSNMDCPGPGNICDQATQTCTGPDPDTGTPKRDSGVDPDTGVPEDTSTPPEDTGGNGKEDTSNPPLPDTSPDTAPDPDTRPDPDTKMIPDTQPQDTMPPAPDTSPAPDTAPPSDTQSPDTMPPKMDSGMPPQFSGCQSDGDCSGRLTCNTSLGRCEDPRTKCTQASDCGSQEACLAGRCVQQCPVLGSCPSGLTCKAFGSGTFPPEYCVSSCSSFGGSASNSCGQDQKCVPYFGSSDGLCRASGKKTVGQTCKDDFGADACAAGSFCSNKRGDKRCVKLCSSNSSPSCGSNEYCQEVFTSDASDNPVSNPAGFCEVDCGGLNMTNSSVCSSQTPACQPTSSSHGYCTKQGSASTGQSCGDPGTPYCKTGLACIAASSMNQGTCRYLCDPGKSQSNNNCQSGQACVQLESGFGLCITMCSSPGTQPATCPSSRPNCERLRSGISTTPTTASVCFAN